MSHRQRIEEIKAQCMQIKASLKELLFQQGISEKTNVKLVLMIRYIQSAIQLCEEELQHQKSAQESKGHDGGNGGKEEESTSDGQEAFIENLTEAIRKNINQPDLSVQKLVEELNTSHSTLYRKVKAITGTSLIKIMQNIRMEQAALLLQDKRRSIQEVAELVGYNDLPTFRKQFQEKFHQLPSEYRQPKTEEEEEE